MEADGGQPKPLTKGGLMPLFFPDSQWMFFRDKDAVWKVSVEGGEAQLLTGPYGFVYDYSPDGKWIAYRDQTTKQVGIVAQNGNAPPRLFARMPLGRPMPRWTPDSRALSYLVLRDGATNVWLQTLDGSPPRQVTDFKTEFIHYYDWSPDGQQLVCARGRNNSDVVLMNNFR